MDTERAEAKFSDTGQIQLEMVPIRRACWFRYLIENSKVKKKEKRSTLENEKKAIYSNARVPGPILPIVLI